jgi:predicted transcriptional regulator
LYFYEEGRSCFVAQKSKDIEDIKKKLAPKVFDAYQALVEAVIRADHEETIKAVQAGLADVDAGRTKTARSAVRALARKYGFKINR